jgi:hypothetical protein
MGSLALASPASTRADFEDLFRRWAAICVNGFERLKSAPSVPPRGSRQQIASPISEAALRRATALKQRR